MGKGKKSFRLSLTGSTTDLMPQWQPSETDLYKSLREKKEISKRSPSEFSLNASCANNESQPFLGRFARSCVRAGSLIPL